jgi:aldehyde reductase
MALRYSIQCGVTPLPKSSMRTRIYENFNIFDFQMSPDEMNYLKSFHEDANQICKFHFAQANVNYPFANKNE